MPNDIPNAIKNAVENNSVFKNIRGIPRNVLLLGVVSFLTDASSEMIFAVLPLFYASLGIGGSAVGIIEGISESVATFLHVFSGWFSDRIRKRKALIFAGYFLSSASKTLFLFAGTARQLVFARGVERIGKGMREPPRDALVAESVKPESYGMAFGIHRMLDTAGAILGVVLSLLLISKLGYRGIFLIALIPAFLGAFLVLFTQEKRENIDNKIASEEQKNNDNAENERFLDSFLNLDFKLKIFIGVTALFALANFSYAFFILRVKALGYSEKYSIALYLLYNIFYAALSSPIGALGDKISKKLMLSFGYALFMLTCIGFAFLVPDSLSQSMVLLIIGLLFLFYGASQAIVKSLERAYVAEITEERRGTAYGIFYLFTGFGALGASIIAGVIWEYFAPQAAFLFGAGIAGVASIFMFALVKK